MLKLCKQRVRCFVVYLSGIILTQLAQLYMCFRHRTIRMKLTSGFRLSTQLSFQKCQKINKMHVKLLLPTDFGSL